MIIFSLIILRSWFSIRTLMYSFWNFPTHVGNTLLVDDTPYKSIFNDMWSAMFLELFQGPGSTGITSSPSILPYLVSFHFLGLMFRLTWNIILLRLLKTLVKAILITRCYLKNVMIVVMQCIIQKQNWKKKRIYLLLFLAYYFNIDLLLLFD
jgi:hypothetical protein